VYIRQRNKLQLKNKNMKNFITIIIITIILISCRKRTQTTSYHYLKVENTTNHDVMLGLSS